MMEFLGNVWITFMLGSMLLGVTGLMLLAWYMAIKAIVGRIRDGYWS